jgi:microcystin-dependent protein
MASPYVGEIRCFGFNFAPVGWAFCNGQLMPIAQNDALFAIIGTIYGGDGVTTFALPNLQGQIPMHWGNGPGGFNTSLGQVQGTPNVTLTTQQIPIHAHTIVSASVASGGAKEHLAAPSGVAFIGPSNPDLCYTNQVASLTAAFSPKAISIQGGSQAHDNMQPYLTLSFCIALEGVFPSRN